ncbi:MAG: hypothetical protein K2H01_11445 [Ruminococcus sp.]|nr:hypothetical protein [Ruminococcus sp.]
MKYFNRLKITDEWKRQLIDIVNKANSEGKSVVLIAVARKMARLFEYHRKNDLNLDSLFDSSRSIPNYVITEHAVPLSLANIDSKKTEIIILDDLIIYGDTVESITENVYFLTGIESKIIAMAASSLADYTFRYGQLVYPNQVEIKGKNRDIIDIEEIPAFTAKNNWDIISLDKSIDLEHTILKIKGDFSYLKDNQEKILKVIKERFKECVVYPVTHKIPGGQKALSITVIFDKNSEYRINEDFTKIRIFFGSEGISITAYTPNYWDESLLEDDNVRFGISALNCIWDDVRSSLSSLKSIKTAESLNVNDIQAKRIARDFNLRIEQTAVVIANYLLSFESVMIVKSLLQDALTEIIGQSPCFEISSGDMSLLMGTAIATKYQPQLQEVIGRDKVERSCIYNKTIEEDVRVNPLIPSDKLEEYRKEKVQDCHLSSSVQMALTLIFYRLWKSFGLVNNRVREDRIKVGETFESLYETLSLFFSNENLLEEIHKWIDTNIDLGVVVPKYEFFINRLGYRVWRRYFRAGEREAIMTDTARAALCLITDSFGLQIGEFMTISFLEEKVYPVLKSLSEVADGQLNLHVFKRSTRHFSDSEDETLPLWIYLIMLGAFDLSKDEDSSVKLADVEGHPLFTKTALFIQ